MIFHQTKWQKWENPWFLPFCDVCTFRIRQSKVEIRDPGLYHNATDPEHCLQVYNVRDVVAKSPKCLLDSRCGREKKNFLEVGKKPCTEKTINVRSFLKIEGGRGEGKQFRFPSTARWNVSDRNGSGFNQVSGSVSGSGIQIQEDKNDP